MTTLSDQYTTERRSRLAAFQTHYASRKWGWASRPTAIRTVNRREQTDGESRQERRAHKARRPNMNRSNTAHPPLDSTPPQPGIGACPLCGGDIQSTREAYYKHLRLSPDGQDVVDDGRSSDVDGDSTVYCENDHTQAEMIDKIAASTPPTLASFVRGPTAQTQRSRDDA